MPITAIVFGGRRRTLAPLVYQARDWAHGVLVGASVASETTAAATGKVGVVRRDPMAMQPFCGYNYADYWQHWLNVGAKLKNPPKIFHVNWFRRDEEGKFLWPGIGDNLRVLAWMLERVRGHGRRHGYGHRRAAPAAGSEHHGSGHRPGSARGAAERGSRPVAQGSR